MKFWDASALVPLVIPEPATLEVTRWLRDDPVVAVWTLTRVEILSALARRRRERPALASRLDTAREKILNAWPEWTEVTAVDVVRHHAERLVAAYPLRAADALQLGAALVVARGATTELEFLTLDERQAEAARREGFRVPEVGRRS